MWVKYFMAFCEIIFMTLWTLVGGFFRFINLLRVGVYGPLNSCGDDDGW